MIRHFTIGLLLLMSASANALAQERPDARSAAPAPAVTISTSSKGVRFAALGGVKQIRLEVFGAGDEPVYGSDFQAGNVRDWALEDKHGQLLPDGTYVCVITFRDISGRLGVRQGTVLLQGGKPSLQLEAGGGGRQEVQSSPPIFTGFTPLHQVKGFPQNSFTGLSD